jgi:hypothetical protein
MKVRMVIDSDAQQGARATAHKAPNSENIHYPGNSFDWLKWLSFANLSLAVILKFLSQSNLPKEYDEWPVNLSTSIVNLKHLGIM